MTSTSQSVHNGLGGDNKPTSKYKRILLKLSGEAQGKVYKLEDGTEFVSGFDTEKMRNTAKEIKAVHELLGVEIVIVIGGGNIFRGREARDIDSNTADYMGMLATVQNALAFEDLLKQEGVDVRMNSSLEITGVAEPYIWKKVRRHLQKGRFVICAGGLGEPGFTTDTASAQRALNLHCQAIFMAKQGTDGIYSANPDTNPEATKFSNLTHFEVIARDLEVMDATAATHAGEHNIDIVVYDGGVPGMLEKALCEPDKFGTLVRTIKP